MKLHYDLNAGVKAVAQVKLRENVLKVVPRVWTILIIQHKNYENEVWLQKLFE